VGAIDDLKKLKAEAEDMNFFKRIMTSKTRKPATDIFDVLVERVLGKGNEDCIGDTLSKWDSKKNLMEQPTIIDPTTKKPKAAAQNYFTKTWLPQRTILEKAGFGTVKTLK
jgi:hypothetical protein